MDAYSIRRRRIEFIPHKTSREMFSGEFTEREPNGQYPQKERIVKMPHRIVAGCLLAAVAVFFATAFFRSEQVGTAKIVTRQYPVVEYARLIVNYSGDRSPTGDFRFKATARFLQADEKEMRGEVLHEDLLTASGLANIEVLKQLRPGVTLKGATDVDVLNAIGAYGWELVSFHRPERDEPPILVSTLYLFKRVTR